MTNVVTMKHPVTNRCTFCQLPIEYPGEAAAAVKSAQTAGVPVFCDQGCQRLHEQFRGRSQQSITLNPYWMQDRLRAAF